MSELSARARRLSSAGPSPAAAEAPGLSGLLAAYGGLQAGLAGRIRELEDRVDAGLARNTFVDRRWLAADPDTRKRSVS